MPVCNSPSCSCNTPITPPRPNVSEMTDWWDGASQSERRAFLEDIGASIEKIYHGISSYEVASVTL